MEKFKQEAEVYRQEAMKQQQEALVAQQEAMAQYRQLNGKAVSNMDWEKIMITFLADYADLISQLKPEDKIKINKESPNTEMEYVMWEQSKKGKDAEMDQVLGLSAEVSKKDITAYKSGKLTREAFTKRVVIREKKPQKKIPDLEVFSSIFKRYYSPDLSETFFTEGSPGYELLEGFGAVFNIKIYSSFVEGGIYFIPATGQKDINSGERDEIIDQLYPKFIDDLKHFIIDYGRTIRSLDDKDHLMLNIKMTRCRNCEIPKNVILTTKAADLKAYDRQKLSPEKALAAIKIKEVF